MCLCSNFGYFRIFFFVRSVRKCRVKMSGTHLALLLCWARSFHVAKQIAVCARKNPSLCEIHILENKLEMRWIDEHEIAASIEAQIPKQYGIVLTVSWMRKSHRFIAMWKRKKRAPQSKMAKPNRNKTNSIRQLNRMNKMRIVRHWKKLKRNAAAR